MRMFALFVAGLLTVGVVAAAPQAPSASPSQAGAFIGTWTVDMVAPEEMKGDRMTVRIWNADGRLAMSVQTGPKAPVIEATGVLADGNMVIASIGHHSPRPIRENGAPIWSTFTLTLDGNSLKLAMTLENSTTIKRGIGRKQ